MRSQTDGFRPVAVEETGFPAAARRVIRRIEIHNDLFQRRLVEIQKQIHQQPVQTFLIGHDLLAAMPLRL